MRIEAYQALGSRVATLAEGPMTAGLQHRQLDVAGWASGVYFLKMTTADGGQVVRRFVVQQR